MARLALAALCVAAGAWAADTAEAHLGHGYDALKQDRYLEAATEFRAALRLDPSLVERARFPLAVALFEMKESAQARQEFEAVRKVAGDHPNILYYLGRLDLMDQHYGNAIDRLTRALEKPPFPDTTYYLGLAYFKKGDLGAAEKWLKQATEMNPRDSVAQYQLGLVYRKLGREAEAKKALALSSELRQHDTDESQLRTECGKKLETGSREEARAVCQKLYDPNNADRLTQLGTIYGQHGDFEAALGPLKRAAELAPSAPPMQYNLAFTYFQMRRFAEARAPLARALERWPDIFQLNALYGAVLVGLGDEAAAYKALHRAHQLNAEDPGNTSLFYAVAMRLGQKSAAAGAKADAFQYYQQAAALRPDDPEARKAMEQLGVPPKR